MCCRLAALIGAQAQGIHGIKALALTDKEGHRAGSKSCLAAVNVSSRYLISFRRTTERKSRKDHNASGVLANALLLIIKR
jgi:hypothetical protein